MTHQLTMTDEDFPTLRAERNARVKAQLDRLAAEYGWDDSQAHSTHDDAACYCACATGGPCEHRWDGAPVEEDGLWTTTCSRCGMWAFSHSMRTGD